MKFSTRFRARLLGLAVAALLGLSLSVGTVSYTSMGTTTTSGITTTDDDVKLTVLTGGLSINQAISLGAGDLTLDVRGNSPVTQTASGPISSAGLQLLGSGRQGDQKDREGYA